MLASTLAATFKEFTRTTPRETWYSFALALRPNLSRVIVCFNGKGGQGKTSLTTHLGGLFAEGQVQQASGAGLGRRHGPPGQHQAGPWLR